MNFDPPESEAFWQVKFYMWNYCLRREDPGNEASVKHSALFLTIYILGDYKGIQLTRNNYIIL